MLTSPAPERSAALASGEFMPTVSASKRANSASPNALAAAICSKRAWMETFTAPTAILSFSVKSATVFKLGLRVLSSSGMVASAHTPFTRIPERVLSHRVSIGGGPPTPKESAPEINESFMTLPPPIVEYVTLMSPRPAARACFSSSLSCSMIMIGRCGMAKPRAICTSFTSADVFVGRPSAATKHSAAIAHRER